MGVVQLSDTVLAAFFVQPEILKIGQMSYCQI